MTFTFTIPNLPPAVYEAIKRIARGYDLSQRQVIIAAVTLLNEEGFQNRKRIETLLRGVQDKHPRHARKVTGTTQ